MISDLGWDSIQSRWKDARLTLFYKVVHRSMGVNAEDYLTKGYSRRRVRNSYKYKQIQVTTLQYSNSFFMKTIRDWDKLPDKVTNSETPEAFHDSLSSH